MVHAGEFIPGDGEIIEGVASVDESAITGESAPVIRESGGDRSAVTGGTRVISDWIKVRVTSDPGHTFLDRMIALVEGAERQKTPNEIALNILLAVLTLIFLLVVVTLAAVCVLRGHGDPDSGADRPARVPDPDDDRRAHLGDWHRRHGSPGAAQRAGDVRSRRRSGRRRAHAAARQDRHDHAGQPPGDRVRAGRRRHARTSSRTRRNWRRSRTKRPRAARLSCWPRRSTASEDASWPTKRRPVRPVLGADADVRRRSGRSRNPEGRGGRDCRPTSRTNGGTVSPELQSIVDRIARAGGTPLVVAERTRSLGVVHLKDIVKGGHAAAVSRAARDGHQDRHDHRRQPADRRLDRQRSRRR